MKKQILLVNDAIVFNFIHSKITALTGSDYDIQSASSTSEILNLLNKYLCGSVEIDNILFIELRMPIQEGIEFIDALKKMEFPHKETQAMVILLSSLTTTDKGRIDKLGVRHCISRPPADDDLRSLIFN